LGGSQAITLPKGFWIPANQVHITRLGSSILITPIYLAKFTNGEWLGLYAFIAAIVGGFNQVRGAIVGGLVVGVIDNLAAAYVSTAYRQAVPLCLLVLIILFRPQARRIKSSANGMRRSPASPAASH
jgi:ribose/xylose/arabinose/galactoside ABC-type transport system permease subunit